MADEKQLTVAELLARNAKEHAGAESEGGSRRRRRRRSLEDGGVSVAELTGNLEKVTATGPVEALQRFHRRDRTGHSCTEAGRRLQEG